MEVGETLYVTDRTPWREWLEANFDTASEIWLVYPNKATGRPRIPYNAPSRRRSASVGSTRSSKAPVKAWRPSDSRRAT